MVNTIRHLNDFLPVCVCACLRSVARKETLDVHQKNWVCHIFCQINEFFFKKACLLGINMLV